MNAIIDTALAVRLRRSRNLAIAELHNITMDRQERRPRVSQFRAMLFSAKPNSPAAQEAASDYLQKAYYPTVRDRDITMATVGSLIVDSLRRIQETTHQPNPEILDVEILRATWEKLVDHEKTILIEGMPALIANTLNKLGPVNDQTRDSFDETGQLFDILVEFESDKKP